MVDPLKVLWVLTNSTYLVSKFIRLGATDKNEYAPYFEKGVFELYIEENEEINHPLLNVASKDRKDSLRVRYEITGGNIGGVFALASKTGVLHLVRPLDYEAVQRYELHLAASDKNTASFATVIVHVKDANDNSPVFERPTYRTQITEEDDRNLPKKVLQVIAVDADKARPGNVVYSLTGQGVDPDNPINNKFDIGRTSGEIFVLKPLDRDEPHGRPQWRFTVFAQDEDGEGLVGYADVQINLKDINDNAPTFPQGVYTANVTENSTAGELVIVMTAVDYDDPEEGGNADILYSIEKNVVEEGTGLPIFEIDQLSGEVRTAVCCLDRERTPDYVIQVVAVDGGGLKGTGTASIRVADVNDLPPRFAKEEWSTEVDETAGDILPELPVLTVTVHDDDENNDFWYRVVEGSGPGADKFEMSRNPDGTGALRVVHPLDYEDQARHSPLRFRVQVKDTGKDSPDDPYHSAYAWINVKLRDINDNAPVIDRVNEHVQVEEDARVGTILETFRARDLDQRGKSKVTFSVDRSSDPGRLFAVSPDGVVTIQRPLDRETTPRHVVRLVAVDDGSPPLTSTATLTITVVDINDNAPSLAVAEGYAPVVVEGEAPRVVAVLTAQDRDNYTAGNGPPFVFLLDPAAPESVKKSFRVDQQLNSSGNTTVIVTSLRSFDREEQKQYLVPILIQDGGRPPQTGTSTLTVIIGDVNDNFMSPGEKEILVYNYMGQMPDAEIGTVWVRDLDDWDVGDKTVSWDGPEHRNFRLREETGMLTLRQGSPPGTYQLKFKVFDRRHVQRDVSANVTVVVKEVPYQAVAQASSLRLTGMTDQDFIRVYDHGTETRVSSKAELLRDKLATLLGVTYEDVDIVSVRQRSVLSPVTDVWYSAHNGRHHYFTAIRLQSTALLHWTEIESYVGVNISMVGVNECMDESRCEGSCTTTVSYGPGPHLVNANCTALTGVQLEVRAECSCGARNFTVPVTCADRPCYNGGHCRQNKYGFRCSCSKGYTGPRCQQLSRSFRGNGYAWFPTLQFCDSSHLSLEFVTQSPEGQLLYNGPVVPTKPGEERISDYISLELTRGNPRLLIDFGSGTLELKIETKKGLNDGDWHRLDVFWEKQEVTMTVDLCKAAVVNETEDGVSTSYDDSACRVRGVTPNCECLMLQEVTMTVDLCKAAVVNETEDGVSTTYDDSACRVGGVTPNCECLMLQEVTMTVDLCKAAVVNETEDGVSTSYDDSACRVGGVTPNCECLMLQEVTMTVDLCKAAVVNETEDGVSTSYDDSACRVGGVTPNCECLMLQEVTMTVDLCKAAVVNETEDGVSTSYDDSACRVGGVTPNCECLMLQEVTMTVDLCKAAVVNETEDGVSTSYDDSACRVGGVTPNCECLMLQEVTMTVDLCKAAVVNETEDGVSTSYDDSACRVGGVTPNFNERLNLATPLQLGGRLVRELDPTLFQWKAVPYGVGFDGCIRNVFHNSILYDLGSPGMARGSVAGCPQADARCASLSCAYQGRCEASLREARCACRPGFTGPSCASPTVPAAFKPHSYVKYALSFEPDQYSSQMQIRFRTREQGGELLRTMDQHNKEYAVLEIEDGKLKFRFNLNGAGTTETVVWLANLTVNDGQWHDVNAWRHGCFASLAVDGGEGREYNESLPSVCSHHWLEVDKQEGVYVGGKAEYTGLRTFEVLHDFHDGCLDDVRLHGRFLPLPPAMNGTQWGQATMARNLERYCPSSNSCVAATCPDPFICIDLWHEFECSCGEGQVPTPDGRDCVDENECIDNPCRNGGVCVNQEPRLRYRCLCPAPFLGKNCDVVPERQTVKLGLPALITILASLFFILMLILLLVLYNRRRETVAVAKKPRPDDDVRENIISYNDEGGGEDDMTAFDISPLQVPLTTSSTSKTDIIALSTLSEERDWGPSIAACRTRADNDLGAPPYDDLRNYAYEGGDSETDSLSSLFSESDSIQQLDQLQNWGPKFIRLASLYQTPSNPSNEDDDVT